MKNEFIIGLDAGSVSLKMAAFVKHADHCSDQEPLFDSGRFFEVKDSPVEGYRCFLSKYIRHRGEVMDCASDLIHRFLTRFPMEHCRSIHVTGSGGKVFQTAWSALYVNEFRAVSEAIGRCYPEIRTVFEMGGNSSKYILLGEESGGGVRIVDYETNGECAAGTGAFFDQQADRLKIRVEEIARILPGAKRTASIAGRCSVFAKSDMIHAQQRGYRPEEVMKGLCDAVVRNFKGSITKGKAIQRPAALIGGVAANPGVVQAFREHFAFDTDGHFVVPEFYAWMGAIGSALLGMKRGESTLRLSPKPAAGLKYEPYPTIPPLSMGRVRLPPTGYLRRSRCTTPHCNWLDRGHKIGLHPANGRSAACSTPAIRRHTPD